MDLPRASVLQHEVFSPAKSFTESERKREHVRSQERNLRSFDCKDGTSATIEQKLIVHQLINTTAKQESK